MPRKNDTKASVVASVLQLITGVQKHYATGTQVAVAGETLTAAQIVERLQSVVTLRGEAEAAKATARAKIADEEARMPSLRTFVGAFASIVQAAYIGSPDVLADFGLQPKSRATPNTAVKTAAVVKRQATRQARHTMGPKQKARIKGDVIGVAIVPQSAPLPVAVPSPSPSAPAPSSGATAPAVSPVPAAPPAAGHTS